MSLKVKIILFFALWNLLLILLLGDLYLVTNNANTLADLHLKKYESRLLAEELKDSSDELTRMARTYIVTGDPKYFEYFNQIIAIRDGKAIRPDNYQDIYWDYVLAGLAHQNNGRQVSMINLMRELQFSQNELSLL